MQSTWVKNWDCPPGHEGYHAIRCETPFLKIEDRLAFASYGLGRVLPGYNWLVLCSWTDGQNVQDLTVGFDQEAAAVIIARLASHKMETEEEFDATR